MIRNLKTLSNLELSIIFNREVRVDINEFVVQSLEVELFTNYLNQLTDNNWHIKTERGISNSVYTKNDWIVTFRKLIERPKHVTAHPVPLESHKIITYSPDLGRAICEGLIIVNDTKSLSIFLMNSHGE